MSTAPSPQGARPLDGGADGRAAVDAGGERPASATRDDSGRAAAPKVLEVSWQQYNTLVEELALAVHESAFAFNQIICIARGGLRVGDVLSRIFEVPLAILSTHSYAAQGGTVRGELIIAEHMTMTSPRLGERVLLVDDMVDSGHTLDVVHRTLPQRFPVIAEIRTAVLWWKGCSVVKPDYWVQHLPENPWIRQPFEVYDVLRPEGLREHIAATRT